MNENLTIIIPCYNESQNVLNVIPLIIDFCEKYDFQLIIVNDGSSDNTLELLNTLKSDKLVIVNHKVNRGYGAAIKTGILNCKTQSCVTIDADGQHNLHDIIQLLEYRNANDFDLVIGNRNFGGSTLFRNIGKYIIHKFTQLFIKIEIKDLNSGMKMYNTNVVKSLIKWAPDTMAYSDIITLLHFNFSYKIGEYPITINNRMHGTSTINYKTAIETIREIAFIIVNIFPFKFFSILSVLIFTIASIWSIPFIVEAKGLTVGGSLLFFSALIIFLQGILLEILCRMRFENYNHVK
jgi:glycosyltransferase involved in cell wall biosynthesis